MTAVAAALLLSFGSAVVLASPAAAHDELVSTDPVADSTVEALPAQLTLTYSADILTEAGTALVEVTDAAGTSLTDGEPVVAGTTVTQALTTDAPAVAAGAVTVLWKVVSSDGHPISGEFAFTLTTATTPTPTATAEPTETATPAPSPTETDVVATPISAPVDEDSTFAQAWPWVIGGIVIVAIGGAVVYLLVSRARRQRDLEKAREGTGAAAYEPPHEH